MGAELGRFGQAGGNLVHSAHDAMEAAVTDIHLGPHLGRKAAQRMPSGSVRSA
ncbi:hypothetical protein GCM10010347_15380 [Streptomyces cirratus]|uniref:Uncharacterized protein n=1 Tax=Streptomyces cirratus TaxID=68187 RepID=A0ABQ3EMC5_9ACTN|nr:hypothetical protein GCM10010347_15380 [Streptomyces cirratus]